LPLTIYLLSGWLQTHYPDVNWFSHDAGRGNEAETHWPPGDLLRDGPQRAKTRRFRSF
jgi:hypothetical protein